MPRSATHRVSLVTGGAGFIGSHLVEHLTARGDHVIVVDDLSTGRLSNLHRVDSDRCTVIQATVRNALPQLAGERIDEVYHLAAAVGVRLVIDQPIRTIETNVLETSGLLEFLSNLRPAPPTFIASSSEIYGKSTRVPFREDDDVTYGPTIFARWSYACSKAIDEYLALAHHQQRGTPVVIARFFNTIGPRQVGEYGMVVPRFVAAALTCEPIQVYGDGAQTRCFCDVRDVVTVLPRLLAEPACAGRVFNVGSDERISIDELARLVRETLGSDSPIVHVPYDEAFGAGFDDLRHRQPALNRLREATGFSPRIPLAQTIRDLAEEMKQQGLAASSREVEASR